MTDRKIPVLTDLVLDSGAEPPAALLSVTAEELEELQDRLAHEGYALMERLLHESLREMEANLFADVIGRLRAELPSLVQDVVNEHLGGLRARSPGGS
jgi:hypothetical protein